MATMRSAAGFLLWLSLIAPALADCGECLIAGCVFARFSTRARRDWIPEFPRARAPHSRGVARSVAAHRPRPRAPFRWLCSPQSAAIASGVVATVLVGSISGCCVVRMRVKLLGSVRRPKTLYELARREGDDDDELWACDVAGV